MSLSRAVALLEAVVGIVEELASVAPETVAAAKLAIILISENRSPTEEELQSIESALKASHDALDDELTRKLK